MGKTMSAMMLFTILFFVAGCAYIDQNLKVAPELKVTQENVGNGLKVAVSTVDDRDEELIGRRANGYGFASAKITNKQDMAGVLSEAAVRGLRAKGFEPVLNSQQPVSLKITLRSLKYESSVGLWTAGNTGVTVIKVNAANSAGATFEKTYRSTAEVRTAFIASQETNAKVVNEAFGDAIGKMMEDKELLEFLKK